MEPQGPTPSAPLPLPLEQLLLTVLLGALACVLVSVFVPSEWIAYYALRLWLPVWVMGAVIYGGPRIAGRSTWMTKLVRFGRGQFVEWGGGPYAAIAIACFLWIELAQIREFYDWIAQTDWYTDKFGVRAIVRDAFRNVFDFFISSVMNGLYAFIWPAFWKKAFSVGNQWPAVAVAWALFEAGKWTVRTLPGREPPPGQPPSPG